MFNNQRIGWILFIMLIAGYSAYYYKTEVLSLQLFDSTPIVANDFNEVLYDTDGNLRDLDYIVSEYKKFFIGSDWENMPDFERTDESDGIEYLSTYNKDHLEILSMFTTFIDKDQVLSIVMIYPYETGREKITEMMSYTKPGFKVFGSMYTKDRELLQEIYEDIPQLFAQYMEQDDLNEALSKTYEVKNSDLSIEEYDIYIYIYRNTDEKFYYGIILSKTVESPVNMDKTVVFRY